MIQFEGGLSDDNDDNGGLTNFGISQKQYPNLDIKNLTMDEAMDIYYKDYFLPNRDLFKYGNEPYLFDCVVNMGRKTTVLIIQRSLNALMANIVEDGVFGNQTKKSLECKISSGLVPLYKATRSEAYRLITAHNPTQEKFLKGWLKRSCSNYY